MVIDLGKFGTTLTSRQAGREALAAFQPILKQMRTEETLVVDFDNIVTFSPSWGDEFLKPLREKYGTRLFLKPSNNLSVTATLQILEETQGVKFQIS